MPSHYRISDIAVDMCRRHIHKQQRAKKKTVMLKVLINFITFVHFHLHFILFRNGLQKIFTTDKVFPLQFILQVAFRGHSNKT